MLTLNDLTNRRLKTRRRNRNFIYSMGAAVGLLGMLLGSGWLFIPNIVPYLAGSAILVGSPLAVILFGLAGLTLGLFIGKQAINLGRSLLHIVHGEKTGRSWLRVGFATAAALLMIPLITTGALPIAATGFAGVALATTIVVSSIALATFIAKHAARFVSRIATQPADAVHKKGYALLRDSGKGIDFIARTTNPAKQSLNETEQKNLQMVGNLAPEDGLKIVARLNEKIAHAKWVKDEQAEAEAKAARDMLHLSARESVQQAKAQARLAEVSAYAALQLEKNEIRIAKDDNKARHLIKEELAAEKAVPELSALYHSPDHKKRSFFESPFWHVMHTTGIYTHKKLEIAKDTHQAKAEMLRDTHNFAPLLARLGK